MVFFLLPVHLVWVLKASSVPWFSAPTWCRAPKPAQSLWFLALRVPLINFSVNLKLYPLHACTMSWPWQSLTMVTLSSVIMLHSPVFIGKASAWSFMLWTLIIGICSLQSGSCPSPLWAELGQKL